MKTLFLLKRFSYLIIIVLFSTDLCFANTITFHDKVDITELEIKVSDIAWFGEENDFTKALGSQIIGRAPKPGQSINIKTVDVQSFLNSRLPLPPDLIWKGGAEILVSTPSVIIGPDKIEDIIAHFLTENAHKLPLADITFKTKTYPLPFHLPTGNLTWEVVPSSPNITGSTSITIIFKVDERVRKNIAIRGDIQALSEVAIALVPIRRGTIITEDQISLDVKDISNIPSPCIDLRQIIGKEVRANIRANNVIELTDITIPPIINRGDIVKIVLNAGGLHLTASGIAKMDGKINEVIRVKNTSSNKLVHCRVMAPGIVEVNI